MGQRKLLFNEALIKDIQTKFINLNTSDGLSSDVVTDILQDKKGLMWICTLDGINSYDGSFFNNYYHIEGDSLSPQSNEVYCGEEDEKGNLFFGTEKGLCRYSPLSGDFVRLKLEGSSYSNNAAYIRQLKSNGKGGLWIEVLEGALLLYNIEDDSVEKVFRHRATDQPYYHYHTIYYDSDSTLWIGGRGLDPLYLKKGSDKLTVIKNDELDPSKKRENDVACFYEDSRGDFWVSALDGVYLLDRESLVYKKFIRTSTWDIIEDEEGNIWFAGGSGIYKYIPATNLMVWYTKDKDNPASIASNSILKIYQDYHNNLWFATNNGISILSPSVYPFGSYSHIPGIAQSPQGVGVTAVAEDKKGNLWIGYEENGLDYFRLHDRMFDHYRKSDNGLLANEISSLYIDKQDMLWIALWRGIGFNSLNQSTGEFSHYRYNKTSSKYDWYNDFVEDDSGNFYLGFWGGDGLTLFDRKNGTFLESLKYKFPRLQQSRLITRFLKDNDGNIWFGTSKGGLYIYDPVRDTSRAYFADIENNKGLLSNSINDLCMDNNDRIWMIGSSLQMYMPENDTFVSYGASYGLSSSKLVSLLPDNLGNIWVATADKGLFKFNIQDETFMRYTEDAGLQSNKFSKARLKLSTGDLFFGGSKGFSLFSPGFIISRSVIPKPFFGNLYVNYKKTFPNLNDQERLEFSSDVNNIKIELRSTDAVNPKRYYYQCMLEGYDADWVDVDRKYREISYSFIPAGSYTFKYRMGDGNNWSDRLAECKLVFREPFYESWWFLILVALALAAVLFAIVKQRLFDLKQKHNNLELEQRLFRLQMNPHFIFNALLAIQNFVFKKDVKEAGLYISDFAKLFRLILDNSRSEFVLFEKEVETLNLYLKLQSLRYENKFDFNIVVDHNIKGDVVMIPPMLAQPIIENAVEHGIFKKQTKGKINIRYSLSGNIIYFEVVDDGVGLKASKGSIKYTEHKSSALDITQQRLKVLSKKYSFKQNFKLEELLEDEVVVGTKVSFNLPYKFLYEP
jgi:ligand-binding sensor domain-containing protein